MAKPSSSKKPAPKSAPKVAAKTSRNAPAKAAKANVAKTASAKPATTAKASANKLTSKLPAATQPVTKPQSTSKPMSAKASPKARTAPARASTSGSKAKSAPLMKPPPIIAAKVELRPPPPPKHRAVLAAAANAAANAASSEGTTSAPSSTGPSRAGGTSLGAGNGASTSAASSTSATFDAGSIDGGASTGTDGKPVPPRPSRPPAPVTGTAAMKNLAQRNAAALRPATDLAEMSSEAQRILAENDTYAVGALGDALAAERSLAQTCKVLDDVLAAKPDLLVGLVDRFVALVPSSQKRTVQTVAAALPVMARLAPARVARHLQTLTERFPECSEVGKDGLVSTFAALCMASVAYQKRLEPVLELALSSADPKSLQRWAEIILPSLKGEPHARARAVVEGRLPAMPRPLAQPIATFLGIKLRPVAP